MNVKMESNVEYYEFLDFVNKSSKKQKSIQKNAAKIVFENFHLCLIKKELEIEIQKITKLLSH